MVPNLWGIFVTNLMKFIMSEQDKGREIIIGMDGNQEMAVNHRGIDHLQHECGLHDIHVNSTLRNHHPPIHETRQN